MKETITLKITSMKNLFIFLTVALCLCAGNRAIAQVIASGMTGSCTWTLTGSPSVDTTLTISGNGAMANHGNAPWSSYRSYIKTLSIQQGVTSIGNKSFYYCSRLTSVTIPNSVTSIGDEAFTNCSGLTGTLTIPNSVTSIGNKAFTNCSGLTGALTIPDSLTYIGNSAFAGCSNLTTVNFNAINCTYTGGSSYNIFEDCLSINTLNIGNNVQTIPNYAFQNRNLTSVTIPSSVTSIGDCAFRNCSNLTTVNFNATNCTYMGRLSFNVFEGCSALGILNIGNNVQIIPDFAFCKCSNLAGTLTIPNSVISIGERAFYYCNRLNSITIPPAVTSIGESAFYECTNLATVNFNATNCTYMGSLSFTVFEYCSSLRNLNIGNNVQIIPDFAFRNCSSLNGTLAIPNSVTSIGNYTFSNCSGLTSAIIGNSVTTIGYSAFSNCNSLTEMYVKAITPPSVNSAAGREPFYNVSKTIPVHVPVGSITAYKTANVWKDFFSITETNVFPCSTPLASGSTGQLLWTLCIDGQLTIEGNGPMPDYETENEVPWKNYLSSITEISIEEGITSISDNAFSNCINVETVSLPGTLISIGYAAFYNCENIRAITLPQTVSSIGPGAFYNCIRMTNITSLNPTPPTIGFSDPFNTVSAFGASNINDIPPRTVTVPHCSEWRYRQAPVWQDILGQWEEFGIADETKLNSLTFSQGLLVPAFNPDSTNYKLELYEGVQTVDISATPYFAGANILGTGTSFPVDNGKFFITCVSPDEQCDITYSVEVVKNSLVVRVTPFIETFEDDDVNSASQIINGNQANKWIVGSAVAASGNRSLYISNDGVSNAYTVTGSSVVHYYIDIYFNTAYDYYQLDFDCKGMGESGSQYVYDYLRVQLEETDITPVAGTRLTSSPLGIYVNQSDWTHVSIPLPDSYKGTSKRLIFSWVNDDSYGEQPPAAIDNISVRPESASGISTVEPNVFTVYPNPAKDIVTVKQAMGKRIAVYNSIGIKIYERDNLQEEETFSVSSWSPGFYLVQIISSGKLESVKKLVIE